MSAWGMEHGAWSRVSGDSMVEKGNTFFYLTAGAMHLPCRLSGDSILEKGNNT
jgi:hypothetical protein